MELPEVPPNKELRKALEKKSTEELYGTLEISDKAFAKQTDPYNKRRLIRYLEIIQTFGNIPKIKEHSLYDPLFIGLDLPNEALREKIRARLLARVDDGMLEEAKKLYENGLSYQRMEELGLEYRYIARFLQEKILQKEMIESLEKQIWQYARRQRTWFRRNKNIHWFSPGDINYRKEILQLTQSFLNS